jgi:hypothetical protein
MPWNWKKKSITLPADLEDELMKKTDSELEAEAGSMILYEVSSGFVAVSTENASMPKKEFLEALDDIAEAIEEHGVPDSPKILTKKILRN